MSAAAETAKPNPTRIPKLNPWEVPPVQCYERSCNAILQPKSGVDPKTKEVVITYECTNCNYAFDRWPVHANGQYRALGKDKPNVPEVFQKGE